MTTKKTGGKKTARGTKAKKGSAAKKDEAAKTGKEESAEATDGDASKSKVTPIADAKKGTAAAKKSAKPTGGGKGKRRQPEKEMRSFGFKMTTEQQLEAGNNLAMTNLELRDLESERKETMGHLKSRKEELDTRARKLERAVRNGEEERKIECVWRPSKTNNDMMELRRSDNDEVVDERPITDDERQTSFI